MHVILVHSASGVMVYGNWNGQPYETEEEAEQASEYYGDMLGVELVEVRLIHEHHGKQNDGA